MSIESPAGSARGRVVVIGAGIAGLAAAFRLDAAGIDVTVLEQSDRVGGRIMTVERNGYVIDAAASVLPTTYRRTLRLINDAGLADSVLPACDVLGIAGLDRVHHLRSRRRTDLLTTRLLGIRTKAAFTRVLGDLHRYRQVLTDPSTAAAADLDVETIEEYARRVLPQEALDLFIQPLVSDFYLTPPQDLSVVNLFLLLKTMMGARFLNSPDGMRFLPDGLARRLHIELSATATSVESTGGQAVVTWERPGGIEHIEQVDGVIVAVPAVGVSSLLPQLADGQRDFLKNVTYARSMVVALTLTRQPAENAMWLTVPDSTDPDVNVMILDHNKMPGRVPAGRGLVTVYWHRNWAARCWDLDDETVLHRAVAAAQRVLPEIEGNLEAGYVWRWDPCTVARPVGQFRALAAFAAGHDPSDPIQLAGDYFAITTVDSSVTSGERAAARLIAQLRYQ
ncbi:protoporphyrinogen/coproporphyrinogen oxidase [Streptomyces virginiae]|uniref:protoporphyrinogen/coproporphyrinogen oxidase n=1 Tax=Streptomyces virginiae TaxID=1961 RepID=UPI0036AE1B27